MTTPQPAALPELNPADIAVDVVCKAMGGFAPVNTSGVRVTHKPSGISVTVDSERSQHKNKHLAYEQLRATLAALQSQPAAFAPTVHNIKEPYTLAELNARIASNDYNAELLLQHAMLLLNAQPAEVSDATINRVVYEHTKLNPNQADDLDLLLGFRKAVRAILALRPQSYPLPDDLYDSKDWRQGNYASRVEWLHTMYEHAKQERDEYAAQLEALRPQAVPMTEADLLKCLIQANCLGTVHMSHEHGPYYIDRPSHAAVRLKDAMEAHHGITAPAGGEKQA